MRSPIEEQQAMQAYVRQQMAQQQPQQMAGELRGFGDMDAQEKAGNLIPGLMPYMFAPGNVVRPEDITNPPYYRPGMYGPPANEANLSPNPYFAQLLQQYRGG